MRAAQPRRQTDAQRGEERRGGRVEAKLGRKTKRVSKKVGVGVLEIEKRGNSSAQRRGAE